MQKVKIGVLISGGGTNLQSIIDEVEKGNINGEISVVISDRRDAYGIERARIHGIKGIVINGKDYQNRDEFINALINVLVEYKIELVVLAGFLTILSNEFVEKYKERIINVHPSLIPAFCGEGYYGQNVHKAVLDYGAKISGATVHFVDENADTGPVILQESVLVMENDTPETLAARVLKVEHKILPEAVKLYCEGRITIDGRKVKIK
ncbi:MAG: phosphoribosylglycinamide formyltransferase [Eubacteriales bacterium]|nr:phosphoribosylglycinamide formyltransferase [Eubacteriales bacterium]